MRAMNDPSPEACARRFELAFDLAEAGLTMMRENLRRRFPHDDDAAIEARFRAWLVQPVDAPGLRPRPLERL